MYDQIFDDFNIIKEHCEKNGNRQFEESAVFELLENLYPLHGSAQAVRTIIEMLDAQRIRDTKDTADKTEVSDSEDSSDSNDEGDNDIIEIAVPKKIHPFIDLTENSTESDEAVIIEKSENKSIPENIEINSDSNMENNDSEASCQEVHSSSDSDASKHFNEDSNLTSDSVIRSNSEKQLLNYLAILDESNQINQSGSVQTNNDSADVTEMLEENNNDPNNNFDEENAGVNHAVNSNSNIPNILLNTEPPNSEEVLDELFNELFDPIPIPGCSKEITPNFEERDTNKATSNHNLFNPVPGCSKDSDISNNFQPFKTHDDSIEKDITTIQEIIPWAPTDKTRLLLSKYINSPDRVNSTLSRLMKEESINTKHAKRKSSFDHFSIESKVPKVDAIYEMDDSLDITPNLHFDNILSNESSNDSQASKRSGHMESAFKINQNSKFNDPEFYQASSRNKWSHFDNNPHSTMNPGNSNTPVFFNSSLPTSNLTVKKERNETIVSGLLQEQQNLEMLNGKNPNEKLSSGPSTNIFNDPMDDPFFPNGNPFEFPTNASLLGNQTNDEIIKKTVKEEPDNTLSDIPMMNGFANHPKTMPTPNNDRVVIQPSKLQLPNPVNRIFVASPPKNNFVRPATLNLNNSHQSHEKILEPKDKVRYINYAPRTNEYVPPALRAVEKPMPLPNRIQLAPPMVHPVINVPENQAEKNLFNNIRAPLAKETQQKKHNIIHIQRPFNMSIKSVAAQPVQGQARSVIVSPVAQPGTSGSSSNGSSNSSGILDQSIYNKLRSIFPDVKSSYIKKICTNPPNISSTNDKAHILNALIEHLLTEGSNHLHPLEYDIDQPSITSVSIDEKYEYLLGIFPDADPQYIRDFVEKNPSEQEFEQFIQQKLESRDYPTKEQYMARIKMTEQIKQYTSAELNIEKFLELFPDPFKHFEDASRQCTYQPIAMEFLKSVFTKNKVLTINQQYKLNKYNLSLTARALTNIGTDMKTKRSSSAMPTEDIPLLQEMSFIKNKQNIINHLNMLKNKEEQLFKDLKDQNLLLTCQCCYNDECMPTKSSECNEGHVFCHECIVRGTESALADAEAHVRCFTDCKSEFSLATLQKVLPPTKFSALLQKRQTAEVMAAGVDGLVSCPFCHFASIPPPEDKVFKCLNPECMKETCKLCKELNHVPLKCDEVIKTDKARHLIEEKMTEALVRTCYQCKKQFYKEDGCNKMKCTCGALMCYLCSKPIKGYDHFNAQGGANTNLCPLWSDDRLLNAKAVIKVAEDVKKQLLKNNPNLKIDTDSLLPKVPAKTRGPHDDIPNANQLPEHILRIANGAQR